MVINLMPIEHFLPMSNNSGRLTIVQPNSVLEMMILLAILNSHSASWHKSYYLKFNNSKLMKATKKNMQNAVKSGGGKPMKRQ